MAPRSVPHDYDAAAKVFYETGRAARVAGEPRDSSASATNPNNPAAWLQSFRSDPALITGDLVRRYGAVEIWWWRGYDDVTHEWPDRGWRYSIDKGYNSAPINFDGTDATRGRLYFLRWVYVFGWKDPSNTSYGRGKLNPVDDALRVLTREEIDWELEQGQADRRNRITPPLEGYRDPASAGIPPKGASPPPVVASNENRYPYRGYNWRAVQDAQRTRGGFPNGGLWNVLPLLYR